jgi:hypothetical protein
MKAFSFLLALSLFIFPAAIAQQINEGSITQDREQLISIPVIGGALASIAWLGFDILSALGLAGLLGAGTSALIPIILVVVGLLGVLALPITVILISAGFGIPITAAAAGVIGLTLSALASLPVAGGIVTAIGGAIAALLSACGLGGLGSTILGALGLGGAGVAALGGGFSLFAGGAGALTGLTLFMLNTFSNFCAGFPIISQLLAICITPIAQISLSLMAIFDQLFAPLIAIIGPTLVGLCGGLLGGLI